MARLITRSAGASSSYFPLAWMGVATAVAGLAWLQQDYIIIAGGGLIGFLLLAVSLLCFIKALPGWWHGGAMACAVICGLVSVGYALRYVDVVSQPEFSFFSIVGLGITKLIGEVSALRDGQLLLYNTEGAFQFAPTMGLVAFTPLVQFILGGSIVIGVAEGGSRLRSVTLLVGITFVLFSIRFATSVVEFSVVDNVMSQSHHLGLVKFWDPATISVTVFACGALLTASSRRSIAAVESRVSPALMSLTLLGALSLGAAVGWSDPGRAKAGRVVIDDRLSGVWEPAGRLLTSNRYGDFSAYSMSAMVEHLSRRYAVTINANHKYTKDYLRQFDVLVIKTPQQPLSADEIAAIHDWVRRGGGLFAISDHTDLSGMSSHLNRLLSTYGIAFRCDATMPTSTSGFEVWNSPWIPDHPISTGIDRFEFMTGCSLSLEFGCEPVFAVCQTAAMEGDYSRSSNFGKQAPSPARPQGMLVLAATARSGHGRVVAFADSTVLSSFAYFLHDRSTFVNRCVSWLNHRRGPLSILRYMFFVLAIVAAGISLRIARRDDLIPCVLMLSVGLALGLAITRSLSASGLTVPLPTDNAIALGFVTDGGNASLPPVLGTQGAVPDHGNLSTFTQLPQRLGYETRVVPRVPALLAELSVLVILNPDAGAEEAAFPREWAQAVRAWVEAGGLLVVLSQSGHVGHEHSLEGNYLYDLHFNGNVITAEGLEAQATSVGNGKVVWIVGSEVLDVEGLGHCMAYPTREQQIRHEFVLQVFTYLLELPRQERRTYVP